MKSLLKIVFALSILIINLSSCTKISFDENDLYGGWWRDIEIDRIDHVISYFYFDRGSGYYIQGNNKVDFRWSVSVPESRLYIKPTGKVKKVTIAVEDVVEETTAVENVEPSYFYIKTLTNEILQLKYNEFSQYMNFRKQHSY